MLYDREDKGSYGHCSQRDESKVPAVVECNAKGSNSRSSVLGHVAQRLRSGDLELANLPRTSQLKARPDRGPTYVCSLGTSAPIPDFCVSYHSVGLSRRPLNMRPLHVLACTSPKASHDMKKMPFSNQLAKPSPAR